MCGILLAVQLQQDVTEDFESVWELLRIANSARGPDAQETIRLTIQSQKGPLDVRLFASELRLRGDKPVTQPHVDSGNIFCWNGEVFEGLGLDASDNDGVKLFEAIKHCHNPEHGLPEIFQSIEGPYAFCYFHDASRRIYFGRDPLGRRSLLIHKPTKQKPYLIVASVSAGPNPLYDLEEIGTEQLFYVDLDTWDIDKSDDISSARILQSLSLNHNLNRPVGFSTPARVNKFITDAQPLTTSLATIPPMLIDAVENVLDQLGRSVKLMVQDVPHSDKKDQARVAILFSGGIDSTILAYLADRWLPQDEPIDLLNVAFENPRKIKTRSESSEDVKKKRKNARDKSSKRENGQLNEKFDPYLVPDRVTGLEELAELQKICPRRRWNFIKVDVTFEEMTSHRQLVENIMHPCRTVMDISLGMALYFASRGVGHVRGEDGSKIPYTSTAHVLLNGLGSDELLGGYGRHRTAYTSGGWSAVVDELQLDLDRIPVRNLGRDDRIISSHGKEARHPFLSLSVVNYITRLPVHHKMDPRLPLGIGDKLLLRLATRKVGLELASSRKKRAMQFGSHSARMEAGEAERKGDLLLNR